MKLLGVLVVLLACWKLAESVPYYRTTSCRRSGSNCDRKDDGWDGDCCETCPSCNCCRTRPPIDCCDDCSTCSDCCNKPTSTPPPTHQPEPCKNTTVLTGTTNTSCSSSNNTNTQKIDISSTIDVTNHLQNINRVDVPINFSQDLRNDITITVDYTDDSSANGNCSCNTTITPECPNKCPPPVVTPIPIKHIETVPIRIPYPVPTGCCQISTPCNPYVYGGCQSQGMQCGSQCNSRFMYQPRDICQNGCNSLQTGWGTQCGMSGCRRIIVDCSTCTSGFWGSYDQFMRCGGCYQAGGGFGGGGSFPQMGLGGGFGN